MAAMAATVFFAGLFLFASSLSRYDKIERASADGIVVLTGGDHRVGEATKLLVEGRARRLLISGVNKQTSREDLRRLTGLPNVLFDCCVDIGYTALDTIGNAEEAKSWAGTWHFEKLLVVTSNYHMPRSLAEFARVLPSVSLVPHPVVPKSFHADQWWLHGASAKIVLIEYVKYLSSLAGLNSLRLLRPHDAGAIAQTPGVRVSVSKL